MDTNTAKQPTEQKKQELEEKVEQFKQEKTTLPNQAREIMGSSAFEQADKLAQKPQNNDEPLSFEKSFDTNSQAKADEINDIGLESQTPQEQSNYAIIPPDVSEGVKYQKYRNTGVDYFDRKGNLSLLDAYLAKQLGLNVSYNFHKIDMKVDNRTRTADYSKSLNDFTDTAINATQTVKSLLSIANGDTGRMMTDVTLKGLDKAGKGLVNQLTGSRAAGFSLKNNVYSSLSKKGGRPLASDTKAWNDLTGDITLNTERGASLASIGLQNDVATLQHKLAVMKASSFASPQSIQSYENTINTFKEIQALINNESGWKSKENIKENGIKLFYLTTKLESYL